MILAQERKCYPEGIGCHNLFRAKDVSSGSDSKESACNV